MSQGDATDPTAIPPRHLDRPARRRRRWVWLALVALGLGGVVAAGRGRVRSPWISQPEPLATTEVDRGDIAVVLVEGGSLESANNVTVKSKVEALIGLTGGATAATPTAAGASSATSTTTTTKAAATTGASRAATGGTAAGGATGSTTAGTSTTGGTATTAAATSSASAASSSAAGGASSAGGSATIKPPDIRSFTYTIAAHVPLRPTSATQSKTVAAAPAAGTGGGGGGGGRGGRGGGGGGMQVGAEKPGATRILSILPEGTPVRTGDTVCVLDSSTFRDEVNAQLIRHAQARSYVEQAHSALEVNNIALKEYRDGVLPMDTESLDGYIAACLLAFQIIDMQSQWSHDMAAKGLRTKTQVRGDELAYQQAEIALKEARGMKRRLDEHTAPKIIKSLEAKGFAIKADLLAQEAAFGLESDRLRRLQAAVANCTLKAPGPGVVAYANTANRWGRVDNPIQEGITVREGMSIFDLPDPEHLRVRARINESKVNSLHTGQVAEVVLDAYPNQPLRGVVAEITPIPVADGALSDVKNYTAIVNITSKSFDGLRPGLSARLTVDAGTALDVVRVPLGAIRWVDGRPFAARMTPSGPEWRLLELGLADAQFAEVRSGLAPGDHVVATPGALPAPPPDLKLPTQPTPPAAGIQTAARP